MTDFALPLDGGCFCGAVRYRIDQAPLFTMACHCTDCQQMTASAFSLGLAVPGDGFRLTTDVAPRPLEKTADSAAISTRYVCPACAGWTHTTTTGSPDTVVVRPSSLDDSRWVRPIAEIFTRSAHPWARLATAFSYETEFEDPSPIVESFKTSDIRPG
ncbi:GFA family protein [Sphingomonas sp. TREG-RG-20F-R18-01]|uniref:GFA family protein n=1 Tax=Sphingomonas sp. TREG-RG-20F-R18-01 TaxID=2914982 RepID=UPI001F58D97D|nr:GFA family protein [Sphingomonas sp. TREG-RG-20F-R18-01]